MGITHSAALVVGLPFDQLPKKFQDIDAIEDADLEIFGAYYDCGYSDSLIGYSIKEVEGSYATIQSPEFTYQCDRYMEKFIALVGEAPKIYLTTVSN